MSSRRNLIEATITHAEKWMCDDKKLITWAELNARKTEYKVTTEKIVAAIEQFVIPHYDNDQLIPFICAEVEKAVILSKTSMKDKLIIPNMQLISKQDVLTIARYLERIIKIVKAVPKN